MLWNAITLACREIRRNLMRSALTVLGIVIGVWAVITMVTLGDGATQRVKNDISVLGFNLIIVIPAAERRGGGGLIPGAEPFKIEDVQAIAQQVPDVLAVAPWSSRPILALHGNRNWQSIAQGTDNGFFRTRSWTMAAGREFSSLELRGGKPVCIVGETVRKELFGRGNPVGERIRLGKLSYEIVGVLAAKGQSFSGEDQDDLVVLPLRAFQRRMSGNRDVALIFVSSRSEQAAPRVQENLKRLMRERRRVGPGARDDFSVKDLKEVSKIIETTTSVLTAFVSAIAGVSLLVGGVGIMNTMLVTVTERTREIGVRMAIGALQRDVLLQFLVESAMLSAFGGLIGIGLGLLTAAAAAEGLGLPFALNPFIVLLAFAFSAAVGLVFGYYPAHRASRLNPIDALRHE
ncbi:MAG: ABC transporter permease [Planctomycetales bacterium]